MRAAPSPKGRTGGGEIKSALCAARCRERSPTAITQRHHPPQRNSGRRSGQEALTAGAHKATEAAKAKPKPPVSPGREEAGGTRSRRGNRAEPGARPTKGRSPPPPRPPKGPATGASFTGRRGQRGHQPRTRGNAERGPAGDEATANPSAGRTRRATRPKGAYGQARGRTGGGGEAPATGGQATGWSRSDSRLPKRTTGKAEGRRPRRTAAYIRASARRARSGRLSAAPPQPAAMPTLVRCSIVSKCTHAGG